jgi:hypothetical protein
MTEVQPEFDRTADVMLGSVHAVTTVVLGDEALGF